MRRALSNLSFSQQAYLLIAIALLARLIYAAFYPVNLAGDEAYYWDWGRRPDYGYYSKPPLISWLYTTVDFLGRSSLFGIRAAAAVLSSLALLALYHLCRELFDDKSARTMVLIALAIPANAVLSFFLTIDAPLMLWWALSLWLFWKALQSTSAWWVLPGLFMTLALGHLTKQMMMIFPLLGILYISIDPEHRQALRRPGLWLVLFGSYLSLLPPLIWNAQHDWITFTHTKHHFETTPAEGSVVFERLEDFFSFLGTQLGALSPIFGFAILSLSLAGLFRLLRVTSAIRYLLVFGAIPLVGILLLALRQELEPNWPAVFYLPGVILVAAWYEKKFAFAFPPISWRIFQKTGYALGFALVGYFYFSPMIFAAMGHSGHVADPNRRILGHNLVVAEFQKVRETQKDFHDLCVITLGHRDSASHLAFLLPDHPRVYRWSGSSQIESQYEMWPGPLDDGWRGKDALILMPERKELPEAFATAFARTERLATFTVAMHSKVSRDYAVYRGFDLQSWPQQPATR
jgi:4-amino-4-deoxy-L-arabinose transferase-like glycosyltransferase